MKISPEEHDYILEEITRRASLENPEVEEDEQSSSDSSGAFQTQAATPYHVSVTFSLSVDRFLTRCIV